MAGDGAWPIQARAGEFTGEPDLNCLQIAAF
jgi:hypothetical protein